MKRWDNSWFLARMDIARTGYEYIGSIIFYSFAAVMVTILIDNINDASRHVFRGEIVDFYFLGILAMSGFISFSRQYRTCWRNKKLSKKAQFLKSFPISARDTIEGKFVLLGFHMLVQNGLYFLILFLVPSPLHDMLNTVQFFEFTLMWLGYSLVCGSLYIYMEVTLREKKYVLTCLSFVISIIMLLTLFWLLDIHVVKASIDLIVKIGALASLGSLIIAASAALVMRNMSIKRLQRRDIYV
jgi:hypothetical protein